MDHGDGDLGVVTCYIVEECEKSEWSDYFIAMLGFSRSEVRDVFEVIRERQASEQAGGWKRYNPPNPPSCVLERFKEL
jgi:hypothetical protein